MNIKITVHVNPNAENNKIEKMEEGRYKIFVTEPAKENKANFAVLETLADYFEVPISAVKLKSGRTSKIKTFVIDPSNSSLDKNLI